MPVTTSLIEVRTTVDSQENALDLAKHCIDSQLAACVQIDGPITSIYRWQGKVESATEWRLVFKTSLVHSESLINAISQQHNYDLPEILVFEGTASREYSQWVESNTHQ